MDACEGAREQNFGYCICPKRWANFLNAPVRRIQTREGRTAELKAHGSNRLGISSEHESRWRPYVVLFSRHDPASEVLAGVVNSYFTWRPSRDERPPVLYVSDSTLPYAPGFLSFGGHTAVVNGLEKVPSGDGNGEFFGYKTALKVTGSPEGLQFMGKRVALA